MRDNKQACNYSLSNTNHTWEMFHGEKLMSAVFPEKLCSTQPRISVLEAAATKLHASSHGMTQQYRILSFAMLRILSCLYSHTSSYDFAATLKQFGD